jgi:hypothetical protein
LQPLTASMNERRSVVWTSAPRFGLALQTSGDSGEERGGISRLDWAY